MHIRWREIGAVFAVEKPGHLDGKKTFSFQFFDRSGHSAFKVFLGFGGGIPPEKADNFVRFGRGSGKGEPTGSFARPGEGGARMRYPPGFVTAQEKRLGPQ